MTPVLYLLRQDPMVLGLAPSGWKSQFPTPLSAAYLIGCIGTHRCLVLMGLGGETTNASRILS